MDNVYTIGPNGELYHWGIKGMKWGQRRYQNKDGSLTPAGRKRYADEEAKLKSREKEIKNRERVRAKGAKLAAKKAELDAREEALKNPKKTEDDVSTVKQKQAGQKQPRDMDDRELQDRVNRLRNEDAYRDLTKKLGYDGPVTELDTKIAEMEKQKRYLELQRDINNLTPKKVSKGKELVDMAIDKVIVPAVMESGKTVLKQYLTDTGLAAVKKALDKEVAKTKADVEKTAQKQQAKADAKANKEAAKQAKQEAKAEAKANKEAEKQAKKQSQTEDKATNETRKKADKAKATTEKVYEGEIIGEGSSSKNKNSTSNKSSKPIIDAEWWSVVSDTNTTSMTTTNRSSSGRSYVSGYLSTPVRDLPSANVAGYLPAPKDDD